MTSKTVYSAKKTSRDHTAFTIANDSDIYRVCFGNRFSTLSEKTIDFTILCGANNAKRQLLLAIQRDSFGYVESNLVELADGIDGILAELSYLKTRHLAHEATAESTQTRVTYWALFEAVVTLSVALFQVVWLRR